MTFPSDASAAALHAARESLLHALLREELGALADGRIRPRAANAVIPLSFAQERLWFLHQIPEARATHAITLGVRLSDGPIDRRALERAVSIVISRHEALRTVIEQVDGVARQCVRAPFGLRLTLIDLEALESRAAERIAGRIASMDAVTPFDLSHGPLLRALIFRFAAHEHVLLLSVHHIVFDGWSIGIFIREVTAAYAALRSGRMPQLPALPLQYGDFSVWQRKWAEGADAAREMAYWRRQLAGLPTLVLPTREGRTSTASYRGRTLAVQISEPLSAALSRLAADHDATVFMVLFALFSLLLAHLCRQRDIVVGVDVAGRRRVEMEPMIGFFVNELVLRIDLSGNPTFDELVRRSRQVTLDGYAHQDLPYAMIVKELVTRRSLTATPLFQAMFGLDNTPKPSASLGGLSAQGVDVASDVSVFELCLYLRQTTQGIFGSFRYRVDLFDDATIEGARRSLLSLASWAVDDPRVPVEALLARLAEDTRSAHSARARATLETRRAGLGSARRTAIPLTIPSQESTP